MRSQNWIIICWILPSGFFFRRFEAASYIFHSNSFLCWFMQQQHDEQKCEIFARNERHGEMQKMCVCVCSIVLINGCLKESQHTPKVLYWWKHVSVALGAIQTEGYWKDMFCKHKYTVTSKPTLNTMAIKTLATIQYACRISEKSDFHIERIPLNVHALTEQLDEVFLLCCVLIWCRKTKRSKEEEEATEKEKRSKNTSHMQFHRRCRWTPSIWRRRRRSIETLRKIAYSSSQFNRKTIHFQRSKWWNDMEKKVTRTH